MTNLRNRVQLVGHLGQDVELKTFESGKSLATVSLATKNAYRNKDGEKVESTDWHSLIAWGAIAERMAKLLTKGSFVAIEGSLTYETYEDQEGIKLTVCRIQVSEFLLLK